MKTKEEVLSYLLSSKWINYFKLNLEKDIEKCRTNAYYDFDSYINHLNLTGNLRNVISYAFGWGRCEYPSFHNTHHSKINYWYKIHTEYIDWYGR